MSLQQQLEALILASDEPVGIQKMRDMLGDLPSSDIREALAELESHYNDRGIRLVQAGGGWQFRTAPEHAELVQQLWSVRPPRLSRSMLETLAIIAYRQPVTRAEIEALRGIKVSSSILGGLQERGWVRVLGRKEVPGRPHLYGTAKPFLVDFGLESLKDLPDASELMDEDEIIANAEQNEIAQAEAETGSEESGPEDGDGPEETPEDEGQPAAGE